MSGLDPKNYKNIPKIGKCVTENATESTNWNSYAFFERWSFKVKNDF